MVKMVFFLLTAAAAVLLAASLEEEEVKNMDEDIPKLSLASAALAKGNIKIVYSLDGKTMMEPCSKKLESTVLEPSNCVLFVFWTFILSLLLLLLVFMIISGRRNRLPPDIDDRILHDETVIQ